MSKLEKKILETYGNGEELITLIRKVDLERNLNIVLDKIEDAISSGDFQKLSAIAGPILSGVNGKLGPHPDPVEKQKIEYLLADIFEDYLGIISAQPNGQEILNQVDSNLKETCDIAGYNYDALEGVFNVKKHLVLLPQNKSNKRYYYVWNGHLHELDEILRDITDKKWAYSVKELKRLFEPVTGNLSIRCNPLKKQELLVFIHVLKEENLIQPKGKGNSGHFKPFFTYAVDNEGNFLYPNSVNKKHNKLKKQTVRYAELRGKAKEIISANAPKSLAQARDNGRYPPKKNKLVN